MFDLKAFSTMISAMLKGEETIMTASIITTNDGRFGLLTRDGIVGRYGRQRDAKRGAVRRGLTLA